MSKTKKRAIAIVLAAVLLISAVVGGTIAYLTSYPTSAVVNTFTVGKVDIDLKEHKLQDDGSLDTNTEVTNNSYSFMPGDTLPKDPYVTVKEGSEACWLFVRAIETANTYGGGGKPIIKFEVAEGTETTQWKQLSTEVTGENVSNIWYCSVPKANDNTKYHILKDNQIKIASEITSDQAKAMTGASTPKLSFRAAAVQSANVSTVQAAYNEIKDELNK